MNLLSLIEISLATILLFIFSMALDLNIVILLPPFVLVSILSPLKNFIITSLLIMNAFVMNPNFLFDIGASHQVANNLGNMHIHSKYDDLEKVQIGDIIGLKISCTPSATLPKHNITFHLKNILCHPHAKHNLILVTKFANLTKLMSDFTLFFFFYVKYQVMETILM